jgi:peptidoglycan/xylan/chitin deacetylase (PgdA/CDA1 family)
MTDLAKVLKSVAKRALYVSIHRSGLEWTRDQLWLRQGRMHASVLCFHRVTDRIPEDAITISTARFRAIIEAVAAEYRPVAFTRMVDDLHTSRPWRERHVAVTFDDGYIDNYECAAPILEECGVPATFFVTSGFIGSSSIAPWDTSLAGRVGWMNWEHVRELRGRGFDIGSHTLTHCDLGKAGYEEAHREIVESKKYLEDRLGEKVPLFAFPFGQPSNMTEENRALVRQAGYSGCCSAFGGLVAPGTDPFRIPRVPVNNWFRTVAELHFELRALAPWRWLQDTRGVPDIAGKPQS